MPIKPIQILLDCPECHWRGVFAPTSDALIQPAWAQCPEYGCQKLERKIENKFDEILGKYFQELIRIVNRS